MADENKSNANPPPTTTAINTGGGSAIQGNVTAGDDFVSRDKIVIEQQTNIYQTVSVSNQSVAGHESVVFIPFPRKLATEFVGRDAELVELHEKLQQSQMVGVRPAAALTGLGGIGKTQLAVEYAYRYQANYPGGIFWINAADLNRVRSALVETAERMGLRTDHNTSDNALLAGLVKRCQQQPATLLCFDNAPDAVILWRRLTQELNTATLGAAILITTRRRDLPPNMAALDLRRLSDSTVRQLLATARPDLLTDPDLPRLLERLGGLPLVVSLVANALQNSPDVTIADYLAALAQHGEETVHEALDVHVADYDLYREVYTRTLLPVLREQWERLCQQPKSENAQLLLRIAGQLPEAAEIPIARLGLLAGLQDEKVIKPLTNAVNTLWKVTLIEELKADAIRLHPLVRNFAEALIPSNQRNDFRKQCARHVADAYINDQTGMLRLGNEYAARGVAAILFDIITSVDLAQTGTDASQSLISNLQSLLRLIRPQANKLQNSTRKPEQIWQQLLPRTPLTAGNRLTQMLNSLLQRSWYWLPHWGHQRQSGAVEQTLYDKFYVTAVAVLDVRHIISASNGVSRDDHTLKIWDLESGTVERTLTGHKSHLSAVAVIDSKRIVFASYDCTLKIWDIESDTVKQTLSGHTGWVNAVAVVDGTRIVSGSNDHTLKVWNLQSGTVEQTLSGHEDRVQCVVVIDANRVASASDDHTLKVWNLKNGEIEQTLRGHISGVTAVAVVDSQHIVSASEDRTLKVWNLQTGQTEQTLTGHISGVTAVAVVDGQRIVSASYDRTLKVWNLQSGTVEQTLSGHESSVYSVAMLDSQYIASASEDRTLKVWNLQGCTVVQTPSRHTSMVSSVAIIDSKRIVSASSDQTLKVWNLERGTVEQTLSGHAGWVNAVAVIDGTRIISAAGSFRGTDHTLKVWNLERGTVEQTLSGHEDRVQCVVVIDANRVASASDDHTLKIWNLKNGALEQTLSGHRDSVLGVAMVDGQRIVSASADCKLKVWNLESGTVEQTLSGHEAYIKAVAVIDSTRIVSASADCTLKVWNLESGAVEQTLSGHVGWVNGVAAVDGTRIVSASADRTLKVWNLTTGQVLASIGLDGVLQCVAVARQGGRTLVMTGDLGGALYCLELVEPVEPGKVTG
jgi:WD40 repeat protein